MTIYRIHFPLRNNMVLNLVDENEEYLKTYIVCPNYESRSGLTYEKCFEYNGKEWITKTGLVPVSTKILEYVKEGLWHETTGKIPPKEFRDWMEELKTIDNVLRSMYNDDDLEHVVVRVANRPSVYLKRYYGIEKLVASNIVARQGNLEIWRIETFTKKQYNRIAEIASEKETGSVTISSHVLTNAWFSVIAERETRNVEAKLVYIKRIYRNSTLELMPITVLHPEHEKIEVDSIEDGVYLLLHVKSRGVE